MGVQAVLLHEFVRARVPPALSPAVLRGVGMHEDARGGAGRGAPSRERVGDAAVERIRRSHENAQRRARVVRSRAGVPVRAPGARVARRCVAVVVVLRRALRVRVVSDGVSGGQRERIDVSAMEQRERIERRGRRGGVVREAKVVGRGLLGAGGEPAHRRVDVEGRGESERVRAVRRLVDVFNDECGGEHAVTARSRRRGR